MNIPEVRIQYSRLLDPYFKSLFDYQKKDGNIDTNEVYPSSETILEKIEEFKKAWSPIDTGVLKYMQEVLHLDFYQTVLDAYVVGHIKGSISTPIVITSNKTITYFTNSLIHEILHRLISDNKQDIKIKEILASMFPEETTLCRVHTLINAILKKIYLEFLKEPQRLTENKEIDKNYPDYNRAWELVETIGENKIIGDFIKLIGVTK